MLNERMYDALEYLYPNAPEGSWELHCDNSTNWDVAIERWNLPGDPPTQEELNGIYLTFSKQEFYSALAQKRAEILNGSDTILTILTEGYSENEKLSWPKQEAEAIAYSNDNTTPTPLLTAIAARRGITLDDLVSRVLENVRLSTIITGDILGQQQKFEDMLRVATSIEEIQQIDVVYVYPTVV